MIVLPNILVTIVPITFEASKQLPGGAVFAGADDDDELLLSVVELVLVV